MQNYKLKFIQKHYEQKQRSQVEKLWKRIADHQKLKIQVLKLVALRTKARLWEAQKLKTLRSYDNRLWSKRNLRHSRIDIIRINDWRIIYLRTLSYPQEGIFVGITLTLSISGAHLRIILSYYYYSKWLSDISNCKVVELDFFAKEGNLQPAIVRTNSSWHLISLQRSSPSIQV